MLSQRTVGRFQRVLTALFTAVFYGLNPPLDSGNYYNLLYQVGVHPKVLDYLGNKYSFLPVPIARALHDGEAIDSVGRYLNSNYALSPEMAMNVFGVSRWTSECFQLPAGHRRCKAMSPASVIFVLRLLALKH